MGLEADLLLELGEDNVAKQDNGKDQKQTEKNEDSGETMENGKDSSGEIKAKQKDDNSRKDVIEEVMGNKNANCNDETVELQVCDKPSCTNPANKKCSRSIINLPSPSPNPPSSP